ncbi:hypothetical protein IAE16_06380 [Hydrogenobacter sp. T-2]|uniref:hypothetical protein n=1 Tax=Pampinifervens diazotrophicum TaxID=1632018 RepID=UPI002B258ACE|nr:hypothetical protein [Hydrogenobacter sp. T-2]WPM31444.1 hypothetical protein IAE16_06380 [Hydrogenobacter sp. T-2]
MRDLLERVEELLLLQEKLVNLLLISGTQKARLSVNTAFDILYYNVELLDMIGELLSSPEELREDYAVNLILEALSWMGFILPAVEESCPIFLHGLLEVDPIQKLSSILSSLEEAQRKSDYYILLSTAEEVHRLSSLLKYQIALARRAYMNLA